MGTELDAEAAGLMAANPGWVVFRDDRFPTVLFALPGHLRGAFWLFDTDPDRLAKRMEKVENHLRNEAAKHHGLADYASSSPPQKADPRHEFTSARPAAARRHHRP
jgi:hypothetical protein